MKRYFSKERYKFFELLLSLMFVFLLCFLVFSFVFFSTFHNRVAAWIMTIVFVLLVSFVWAEKMSLENERLRRDFKDLRRY